VQAVHEALDDQRLLRVLLAEDRLVRLHEVEEPREHVRDAVEVARPAGAAERVQAPADADPRAVAGRDRHEEALVVREREAREVEMPLVARPHRRHEAEAEALAAQHAPPGAQLGHAGQQQGPAHRAPFSRSPGAAGGVASKRWAAVGKRPARTSSA